MVDHHDSDVERDRFRTHGDSTKQSRRQSQKPFCSNSIDRANIQIIYGTFCLCEHIFTASSCWVMNFVAAAWKPSVP